MRVAFVDGNNYREIPAKCYTRDPFKQRAIENSQMFKDKEIVLERAIEEESDRKKAPTQTAKSQDQQNAGPDARQSVGAAGDTPTVEPGAATESPGAGTDDGIEKKVFDNLAEAIQFIAATYQVQVQTANEARNFLKEKGIKATIKQG